MKTKQNVQFPYPEQNFANGISTIPFQLSLQMLRKTLLTFVAFVLVTALMSIVTTSGQNLYAQAQGRDILEFLGVLTEEQANQIVVGDNAFLIALKRKADTTVDDSPQYYYLLLKDVSPQEKQILKDAASGRWNHFDLLQASLIAEGVHDSTKIKGYESRLNQLSQQIQEKAKSQNLSKTDYTKLIFETLHNEVLTSNYNIEHSNPAVSFDKGSYNCVSATILFNSLAQKSGQTVCGLEMAGHVCSRVKYGAQHGNLDLETTCPGWFSLNKASDRYMVIQSRVAASQNTEATRQTVAKPLANGNTMNNMEEFVAASKKVREISDVQLVAAVYYNQGHDEWLANRLPESAVATAKALFLDPENENAWGNLIGAVNNIALGFSMEQKRHNIAAGLMDQIALLDPNFKDLQSNQFHIYSTWIKELIAAGQVKDAKIVFDYANDRLPNEQRMKQLALLINSKSRNL